MTTAGAARGQEFPRKALHLTTAAVPIGLALGVPQRAVAVLLVSLFGVACAVEVARRRSPAVAARFQDTVGQMLRPHEVTRGITGATWLLATFALTAIAAPLSATIAATWAGAMGDASAAVVGSAWRRRVGGSGKSAAGTVACVAVTALGAWWLAGATPGVAATLGAIAGAVERPAISLDDNVRVTAAVAIAAVVLIGH
jgi:dolichol kinase